MRLYKRHIFVGLASILIFSPNILVDSAEHSEEIEELIEHLDYNPDSVLTYEGKPVEGGNKKKGRHDDDRNYILSEDVKQNVVNQHFEFGLVKTNIQRSFPGSILLANSHLVENKPDIVREDQKPLTYTVDLPGLPKEKGSFTTTPTYADYKAGQNKVLQGYLADDKRQDIGAQMDTEIVSAFSKDQLRVMFGPEFAESSVEASIKFDDIQKGKLSVFVERSRIVYYVVTVELPESPAQVFADNVTAEDLERRINNNNPPIVVDSVIYGKVIYVVTSTSSVDDKAKSFLEDQMADVGSSDYIATNMKDLLKDLEINMYVMSEGNQNFQAVYLNNITDIPTELKKHTQFGPKNTGFPIQYTAVFLKDQSRAILVSKTDYLEHKEEFMPYGVLSIEHYGWYVAYWDIKWHEIEYDEDGNEVDKEKSWESNDVGLTSPFHEDLRLPGNTKNISIHSQYLGLYRYDLIKLDDLQLVPYRQVKMDGTTFNPSQYIYP